MGRRELKPPYRPTPPEIHAFCREIGDECSCVARGQWCETLWIILLAAHGDMELAKELEEGRRTIATSALQPAGEEKNLDIVIKGGEDW